MCLNHVYSKEVLETNKECCVNHKAAKIRASQRRDIPADFCQQHPPDESPFRSVRGLWVLWFTDKVEIKNDKVL